MTQVGRTQPEVCPLDGAEMTPTCIEACIICDIDGYTGTHESDVNGELPIDFCTFFVHNAQWIAFQAASTDLTIELLVSDCEIGVGLEMAIYQSIDCQNFEMVSNCLGGMGGIVGEGETGIFQNTAPLVIGQYYYLAMDGGMGDNCSWTLNVLEGSTMLAPLDDINPILGPDTLCAGIDGEFFIDPIFGATDYVWEIDQAIVSQGTETSINYTSIIPGTYEICVSASNVCSSSLPSCKVIHIGQQSTFEIIDTICEGSQYNFFDSLLTIGGIHQQTTSNAFGCDSTVILDLTILPASIDTTYEMICLGDTVHTLQNTFFHEGIYIDSLTSFTGCDSLQIYVVEENETYFEYTQSTLCEGDTLITSHQNITSSGIYVDSLLTTQGCDSLITYEVVLLSNSMDTLYASNCTGQSIVIGGQVFDQDTVYIQELESSIGCDSITYYEIFFVPHTLDTMSISICEGEEIVVNNLTIDAPGIYTDSLVNINGCDSILTILVQQNICAIEWQAWSDDPLCHGEGTGSISVYFESVSLPAYYELGILNGSIIEADTLTAIEDTLTFTFLQPGSYTVNIIDQEGNMINDTFIIIEPLPLTITIDSISDFNGFQISCQGYSDGFIALNINGGDPEYNALWSSGQTAFSIYELQAGNYEVTVSDALGCEHLQEYLLTEPDSLTLQTVLSDTSCSSIPGITSLNIDGGIPPYNLLLDNSEITNNTTSFPLDPGNYDLSVIDANDCSEINDIEIPQPQDCDIHLPNVFSPNEDRINDFFGIHISPDFQGSFLSLKIFDRWGNMVFILENFEPTTTLWDGTFMGQPVEQGVYVYLIEYRIGQMNAKVISGDVTVVR